MGPRHIKGITFVLATATIWVAASFIAQFLVASSPAGPPALPPFLLTYVCTSLFTIYLPIVFLRNLIKQRRDKGKLEAPRASEEELAQPLLPASALQGQHMPMLKAAAMVAPVWFSAQYIFTVSLSYTSVTSNTILSSSSSLFTYFISVMLLHERFTLLKFSCVASVMAGTALVTLADSKNKKEEHSVLGDGLAVASAALYAVYTVIMRIQIREDDSDAVALLFGYVGVLVAAVMLPVLAVQQWYGIIDVLAISQQAVALAVVNGVLDYVLADYLWARSVLLLGPTVATIAMALQIPLATTADVLIGQPTWLLEPSTITMTAAGTLAILAGFVGSNWPAQSPDEEAGLDGEAGEGGEHGDIDAAGGGGTVAAEPLRVMDACCNEGGSTEV